MYTDHENGKPDHFAAFAKSLRKTFKSHSKDIGLSACVSCAFTDPMPNNIYKEVDFVSVRFYNNAICNWGTSGFEDSLKTWCSTLARVACYPDAAVPKLYVGALAFNTTESGGSGYVSPEQLASSIRGAMATVGSCMGGAMLWDGTEALQTEAVDGYTFLDVVKDAIG